MERLTKICFDGTHRAADNLPCGENSWDYKALLIERLGTYEDTGMGPEAVKVLRNNYIALSQSCNEIIDKIDDLYSNGKISDIYTIEHCPFCGAEKESLEYDLEHCAVVCNECGRNFRVREDLY